MKYESKILRTILVVALTAFGIALVWYVYEAYAVTHLDTITNNERRFVSGVLSAVGIAWTISTTMVLVASSWIAEIWFATFRRLKTRIEEAKAAKRSKPIPLQYKDFAPRVTH
jgi:hypothetical protein